MLTNDTMSSYTAENSISTGESNDSEMSVSTGSTNMIQYGPIQVRVCRKSAPTLENGRRSKHLILVGEEAAKREKRRERNRDAARKLKEKRQLIEDELNKKLRELEGEHSNLQNYLQRLQHEKQNLQEKIDNLHIDPIIEFLTNDDLDIPSVLQQHSQDVDISDASIEQFLNFVIHSNFESVMSN